MLPCLKHLYMNYSICPQKYAPWRLHKKIDLAFVAKPRHFLEHVFINSPLRVFTAMCEDSGGESTNPPPSSPLLLVVLSCQSIPPPPFFMPQSTPRGNMLLMSVPFPPVPRAISSFTSPASPLSSSLHVHFKHSLQILSKRRKFNRFNLSGS